MAKTGYKGYYLVKERPGSKILMSPTGVEVAGFQYTLAGFQGVIALDCEEGKEYEWDQKYESEEHAIRYIANAHRLRTTTRAERFRAGVSGVLSHGGWTSIAATIAALFSALNYLEVPPRKVPVADPPMVEEVVEAPEQLPSLPTDTEDEPDASGKEESETSEL